MTPKSAFLAACASIPMWARIGSIGAFLLIAGMAVGQSVSDVRELPAEMDSLGVRVDSVEAQLTDVKTEVIKNGEKADRIICLQEAAAGERTSASCAR